MSDNKERNFGLDLIRFTAIISVVFYHWGGAYLADVLKGKSDYLSLFGYYGVELFFVLSGFLIGNIIIKSYLKSDKYKFNTILNFWKRRWFRTLPMYLFVLIIYVAIFTVKSKPVDGGIYQYFFFLQNFLSYNVKNNNFFGVSWSLSIEEWFYISFPLLLLLMDSIFMKVFTKKIIIVLVILLYIVVSIILRIKVSYNSQNISWNDQLRKTVILREDSISFGVLLAFFNNYYKEVLLKSKGILLLIGSSLLIAGVIIFIKDISYNYTYSTGEVSFFSKTFLFSMVSLGVMLIVPYFYYIKGINRYAVRVITNVSEISYSLYLLHLFVLILVYKFIPPNGSYLHILLSFTIFIIVSVILANVTFLYVEKFFLNIRNRVSLKEDKSF